MDFNAYSTLTQQDIRRIATKQDEEQRKAHREQVQIQATMGMFIGMWAFHTKMDAEYFAQVYRSMASTMSQWAGDMLRKMKA